MTFSSQLDARQFLINKITAQAGRTATPLSDDERRMLQLNLSEPQKFLKSRKDTETHCGRSRIATTTC